MSAEKKSQNEPLFSQIFDADERNRVWTLLRESRNPVHFYAEDEGDQVNIKIALSAMAQGHLVFEGVPKGVDLRPNCSYHLTFVLDEVRYFAKVSDLKIRGKHLVVLLPTQFFKVNRRANFRVQIPMNLTLVVELEEINDQPGIWPHHLRDVSFGGCCLYTNANNPVLKKHDHVRLRISLVQGRPPVTVEGQVRYVRPANPKGGGGWLTGIQFETSGLSGDIFTLVLSLYRRTQTYVDM